MTAIQKNLIGLQTLLVKEIHRFLRIWTQSLVPPMLTIALYFIIFGTYVAPRVGIVQGVHYLSFITPGLIMMPVLGSAYENTAFSFFLYKFHHAIDDLLVSPMPDSLIVVGYVVPGALRGALVGVLAGLMAVIFTNFHIMHPILMLFTLFICGIVFSLIGFINGVFGKSFNSIAVIPTFIITPLTFLSGVFYSINELPPFWRELSYFNPMTYLIDIFRYACLGLRSINVYFAIIVMLILVAVLFYFALYSLAKSSQLRA